MPPKKAEQPTEDERVAMVRALREGRQVMLLRKGGGGHRRWGRIYFWAMFTIFVTALMVLSLVVSVTDFVRDEFMER